MSATRKGSLVGTALAALLTFTAGPVSAADPKDEKLEQLEAEVAALRAAVAELKAALAAAPALTPAAAQAPSATELERRIDLLAAELEKLRVGEAAVAAGTGQYGLGPAASKVYRKEKGVSIGGYGEMLYQGFDARRDDGSAAGRTDQLDLLRAVVYLGYKFDDRWIFNSEIEYEHADTEEEGAVGVEFAYLDRLIRPEINVRAGLLLVPMGFVNELHEPTSYLGARRPASETQILPSTWRENGLGLFGELGPVAYKSYLVNGFDASGFTASGLRGGRQKGSEAKAEDLAWVSRLDWNVTPGLVAGGSYYWGDAGQGRTGVDGSTLAVETRILEGHVEWKWRGLQLRALAARAELDDVAALDESLGLSGSASVGERLTGGYVEAGFDLLSLGGGSRQELVPYVRLEELDTQARVPAGYQSHPANDQKIRTYGLAWKPLPQIVFKADYQDVSNRAGTGSDQFNLLMGFVY
jgi:hypothetical protein